MALLTLADVRKEFGTQKVLDGVSFFVDTGRKVALIGANGSGKTTILRMIAGLERADSGSVSTLPGAHVGYLPQDPLVEEEGSVFEAARLPSRELKEAWAELQQLERELDDADEARLEALIEAHGEAHHRFDALGGYDSEARAREVLGGLGFREVDWEKPVRVLSGGEKTRLALVQLLVLAPDLLLLDEPTNHVDLEACEWLQEYLLRYPGAALIVSHDRYFLDHVVTHVVELENRKAATYSGNYRAFAEKKAQLRAIQAEQYRLQQREIERLEQIAKRLFSFRQFNASRSKFKMIDRMQKIEKPPESTRGVRIHTTPALQSYQEVLDVRGLSRRFGDKILFEGLTFSLYRGERLGIIGPNGSGKTTLLKTIAGEGKPDAGRFVLGTNVRFRYFAQDLADLDPENTVLEELLENADLTIPECCDALGRFLLGGDALEKSVAVLSGGERCRLAMAKLFAERPNLLILDEPTNHLDIPTREALEESLQVYPGTVLFASHDRYFLDAVATRILELRDGKARSFDGGYTRYREALAAPARAIASKGSTRASAGPATAGKAGAKAASNGQRKDGPRKRLAQLEREIGSAETRLAELTAMLSNPSLHRNASIGDVSREFDSLSQRLQEMYGEWEGLAVE
jgi:ATP-binding cassette subfamily F protein 3